MGICQPGRRLNLLIGSVKLSVADILPDRSGKEMGILKHHPQGMPEIFLSYLIYIDAVIPYLTVLYVIEAVDKVGDRGLAGSRRAYKGYLLPRKGKHFDIVQHHLFVIVAEINIIKHHISLKLHIGGGIAVLMEVLPGPQIGLLIGLLKLAVHILGIDKGYIAIVYLRLLIHQLKYPFGSRKRHYDAVQLLGYLVYWHHKALVQRKKACQRTQCKTRKACEGQHAARQSAQHIAYI